MSVYGRCSTVGRHSFILPKASVSIDTRLPKVPEIRKSRAQLVGWRRTENTGFLRGQLV